MSRTRKSAREAGTKFETAVTGYLAAALDDDRIERRSRNGVKDRGDISGVRTVTGDRVVVECKDYGGRLLPAQWLKEAEIEAGNDDAAVGVVVAKRRGFSNQNPQHQYVLMTLADLAVLLGGDRDAA